MKIYTLSLIILFSLTFLTSSFGVLGTKPKSDIKAAQKKKMVLRRGTKITLQLNDHVSSKDMERDNVVEMMVVLDVKVNNEVLVGSGTFAEGRVTKVRRSGIFGRGGVIAFEGTNIRSVDGQRIPIKSVKVVRRGKNKKYLAYGIGVFLPTIGVIMGTPLLAPFALIGLLIKGREIEIQPGTLVTAEVMQDVVISY